MAGKKNAKVATRGKNAAAEETVKGEFVTVLREDVRKSMYLHPVGVSYDNAYNAALPPWDYKRNQPVPGIAPRAVVTLEEYARYKDEVDVVPYAQVESERSSS